MRTTDVAPVKTRMSLEEFFRATMGQWAEWVDGEVIYMSPVSVRHSTLLVWLTHLLSSWCDFRQVGKVLTEPFVMKLARSVRSPDLMVVRREHLERLKETYLDGPADLVVEIVSPESVSRDYREKTAEYAEAGVPEYWIVDPAHKVFTGLVLEGAAYQAVFEGREGRFFSRVLPGFWLDAAWLWQEPLPLVRDVLRQIGGEAWKKWLLGT